MTRSVTGPMEHPCAPLCIVHAFVFWVLYWVVLIWDRGVACLCAVTPNILLTGNSVPGACCSGGIMSAGVLLRGYSVRWEGAPQDGDVVRLEAYLPVC